MAFCFSLDPDFKNTRDIALVNDLGALDAFTSVYNLSLDWTSGEIEYPFAFNGQFFESLALRGVRACDLRAADHGTSLSACDFLGSTGGMQCRLFLNDFHVVLEMFLRNLLEVCTLKC